MSSQVAVADVAAGISPRRQLVRLCASGLLAYCSYAMCRSPLLPLFSRELGADPRLIGFIVGASTLTGVVLKLPAGAWSDIVGRRALLVTGAAVFALMPFTYLAVSGLGLLIALRVVHGSATAIFGPVASASLSDIAPADRRATWLSAYSTLQGAGQAIGPVLVGYLIAARRFDLAFLLAGAIALSTPVIVWRWPAPAPRAGTRTVFKTAGWAFTARLARRKAAPYVSFETGSSERSTLQQFSDGIKEVARERRVLVASLAQSAQFLLNGSLNAFLPLYAIEVMGMGAAAVGWMFAMQTVTTLATRPAIGVLSDRIGRRGVIITGLAGCSAAVWMISTADSVSLLLAAVFLYAGGVAVTTAATSAYVTDVAPRARYGTAHGVFGTIYDVGDAAGPIVAGLLVAAWGYAPMFQVMAIVAAAAAAVFYVFSTAGGEVPT